MRIESYLGLGQLAANANSMDKICVDLMAKVQNGAEICGKPYASGSNIILNCNGSKAGRHRPSKINSTRSPTPAPTGTLIYPDKPYTASGLVAVMDICVATCMEDPGQTCCMVPSAIENIFPCCRSLGCCPVRSP